MPLPIAAGVLGMQRTIAADAPSSSSNTARLMPAAMLTKGRAAARKAAIAGDDLAHHLRLHGENHQHRRDIGGQVGGTRRRRRAEFARALAQFGVRLDDEHFRRRELAGLQPAGKHGEAHIAAAGEHNHHGHVDPPKGST